MTGYENHEKAVEYVSKIYYISTLNLFSSSSLRHRWYAKNGIILFFTYLFHPHSCLLFLYTQILSAYTFLKVYIFYKLNIYSLALILRNRNKSQPLYNTILYKKRKQVKTIGLNRKSFDKVKDLKDLLSLRSIPRSMAYRYYRSIHFKSK